MEAVERSVAAPSSACSCTFGGAPGPRTGAGLATGYGEVPVEPSEMRALLESRGTWDGLRITKQESSKVVQ